MSSVFKAREDAVLRERRGVFTPRARVPYVSAMRLSAALIGLVALVAAQAATAAAAGVCAQGSTGNDIGYPQCGAAYPAMQSFGIVGVTHGRAFTQNACLAGEFRWAGAGATAPSLYMNLNAAVGSTASNGDSGPAGTCRPNDKSGKNCNYGYNAAQAAYAYALNQGATASTWWLDVETANSWLTQTAINDQAIQGALDFFSAKAVVAGIYSTNYQWNKIAGSFKPGVPVWYATSVDATTAPSYCSPTFDFAGGGVWLVQYSGTVDTDYAC